MSAKVKAILEALRKEEKTKPAKYQHTLAHYAKLYGKSLRTIKRYAAEGKPLDNPTLMAELESPRGRKPEAAADAPPEDNGESSPVTLDESFFAGAGVLAAIDRLERAERERAGAYFRAITGRQPTAVVQNRFKEWMGIVEALRKLALDAPEIRKANDLTIDRDEMDAAIGHIFAAFRGAAKNLPHRASAKLLAARTREEYAAILDAEVEVLLRTLTDIAISEAAKADAEAAKLAQAVDMSAETPPEAAEPEARKKPRRKKK